ncbi:MAG: IS66 family transposase [Myxococcota bacterium]
MIWKHLPLVMPVYHVLASMAADTPLVHNDDTHVKILELMGKRRRELEAAGELERPDRTGLFTTAIVAQTDAGPIALFASGRAHAGENLADLLDRRNSELPPPIQMCDALERNLPEGHVVLPANCLSHGRRQFVDEINNHPELCRHILEQVGKVFANDQTCKREGLVGAARLEFHQRESGPVMQDLHEWIEELVASKTVEPNSGLGKALSYMTEHWHKLTVFLRLPDAPIDNNITERALKAAIRLRRGSLFYATTNGALAGDVFLALIHTTLMHGGNPWKYLTALFVHHKQVEAAPQDWLPWNYEASLARLDENQMTAA